MTRNQRMAESKLPILAMYLEDQVSEAQKVQALKIPHLQKMKETGKEK